MKYIIGVYIKPGYLKVAMYDTRGHYLHFWEENCINTGQDYIADKIMEGISFLVDLRGSVIENVVGAGITVEGCELHVQETLQARLDKPVFADSLTNCQALAEMWQGAGWGKKDLIYVECAEPLQICVIRDKKPDRYLNYLKSGLACADPEKFVEALLSILGPLVEDTKPETVVLNGIGKIENIEFWIELNKSWHRHAGREVPEPVPAELGAEAFTIGAAALVYTQILVV